ncbi:hypothetical protein JCM1841_004009 [Sporobolomyces salmonicolor]
MPLDVLPATRDDLPRIAEIRRLAFANSSNSAALFANVHPADADRWFIGRLYPMFDQSDKFLLKAVLGGEIVAYGIWVKKAGGDRDTVAAAQPKTDFPDGTNAELARAYGAGNRLNVTTPHYHLSMLATEPVHQRKGAATALLRWGCSATDADGLEAYLVASAESLSYYEGLGFERYREPIHVSLPDGRSMTSTPLRRPALTFSPMTASDIPSLAALERLAFIPTTYYRQLFLSVTPAAYQDWMTERLSTALTELQPDGNAGAMVVAKRGEHYAGFAWWEFVPEKKARKASKPWTRPEGVDLEPRLKREEAVAARVAQIQEAYYRLAWIAVHPDHQSWGIGGRLLRQGLEKAAALRLPCHVVAVDEAKPMYERMGFKVVGEPLRQGEGGSVLTWFLVWRPLPASIPAAISIAPAKPSDCARLGEIHVAAFSSSLINQRIFGNVAQEDHIAHTETRLKQALETDGKRVCKAVLKGNDGEERIVGFALWQVPKTKKAEAEDVAEQGKDTEEEKERWPAGTNVELAGSLFNQLDLGIKEPHYHLSLLATDPTYQRTGAGSALLRWGNRKADEEGVDCYLEATAAGISVYQRAGYEMFREPVVGGENDELVLYPMRRHPCTLSPMTVTDIPVLSAVYHRSFASTRLNQYLFAAVTASSYESWFNKRLAGILHDRDEDKMPVEVMVAKRGSKCVGFALWTYVPGVEERDKQPQKERTYPEGTDSERVKEVFTAFAERGDAVHVAHWYLSILAVLPEARGTGVGARLTRWGMDKAEEEGVKKVFLEATELGKPLYERLGFVNEGKPFTASQDPKLKMWPMLYELPKA